MSPPAYLVLFDIDGTLLNAREEAWKLSEGPTGEEVLMGEVDLMRDVIEDLTGIRVEAYRHRPSGKTDAQVVLELFEGLCVSPEEMNDWTPRILEEYLKRLSKVIHGPESTALKPGVRELLQNLSGREEVVLSLLTGNCKGAARLKLATQGLENYFNFEVGAFGDTAIHRDELPALAVRAVKDERGHAFKGKHVVLIGDTPSDVRCVKNLNAKVVAVATGSYSVDSLRAEEPDFVFEDLSNTSQVLSAIFHPNETTGDNRITG